MRTRNVRSRQLQRYALKLSETDRRNGIGPDGYDERGVSLIVPMCVEAHLLGEYRFTPDNQRWGARRFRITTRRYRRNEERSTLGYRSGNRPHTGSYLEKDGVRVYLG